MNLAVGRLEQKKVVLEVRNQNKRFDFLSHSLLNHFIMKYFFLKIIFFLIISIQFVSAKDIFQEKYTETYIKDANTVATVHYTGTFPDS